MTEIIVDEKLNIDINPIPTVDPTVSIKGMLSFSNLAGGGAISIGSNAKFSSILGEISK